MIHVIVQVLMRTCTLGFTPAFGTFCAKLVSKQYSVPATWVGLLHVVTMPQQEPAIKHFAEFVSNV